MYFCWATIWYIVVKTVVKRQLGEAPTKSAASLSLWLFLINNKCYHKVLVWVDICVRERVSNDYYCKTNRCNVHNWLDSMIGFEMTRMMRVFHVDVTIKLDLNVAFSEIANDL